MDNKFKRKVLILLYVLFPYIFCFFTWIDYEGIKEIDGLLFLWRNIYFILVGLFLLIYALFISKDMKIKKILGALSRFILYGPLIIDSLFYVEGINHLAFGFIIFTLIVLISFVEEYYIKHKSRV